MNHPPLSPKYIHQKYIAQAAQQQVLALFAAIAYIMMNSFQYAIWPLGMNSAAVLLNCNKYKDR